MEKYGTGWQATDDNMAHAHCILDTYGYKHTLRICNTNYFSTAKMVARTHLHVTLYVHFCVFIYYLGELRRLVSDLSSRRPGFDPRSVRMRFVEDK